MPGRKIRKGSKAKKVGEMYSMGDRKMKKARARKPGKGVKSSGPGGFAR